MIKQIAAVLCAGGLSLPPSSVAADPCIDVALVIALDGSGSVTASEYRFQQDAVAAALRDPEVLRAMEETGAVALSAIKWGAATQPAQETPWVVIRDARDADRLARKIETMPRKVSGNTGLGLAMERSLQKFEQLPTCAARKIVNISGDGRDSSRRAKQKNKATPSQAKGMAAERDITINALAISREEPDLPEYYAEHVITGPGAFVMEISDYAHYATAIKRKLIREISHGRMSAIDR